MLEAKGESSFFCFRLLTLQKLKISLERKILDKLVALLTSNRSIETLILTFVPQKDPVFNETLDRLFGIAKHLKVIEISSLEGQAKVN